MVAKMVALTCPEKKLLVLYVAVSRVKVYGRVNLSLWSYLYILWLCHASRVYGRINLSLWLYL
jgi:hypothetical protein